MVNLLSQRCRYWGYIPHPSSFGTPQLFIGRGYNVYIPQSPFLIPPLSAPSSYILGGGIYTSIPALSAPLSQPAVPIWGVYIPHPLFRTPQLYSLSGADIGSTYTPSPLCQPILGIYIPRIPIPPLLAPLSSHFEANYSFQQFGINNLSTKDLLVSSTNAHFSNVRSVNSVIECKQL